MIINDCIKGRNNDIYVIHSFFDSNGDELWELKLKQHYVFEDLNDDLVFDNEFVDFKNDQNNFDLSNLYVRSKIDSDPFVRTIIRDYPTYKELFMITKNAQLVSKRSNKLLSQLINSDGYSVHATKIGGRKGTCKLLRIHRAVAEAFVLNPENKPQVNHINGIKTHNYPLNLEWVTNQENIQHAFDSGLSVNKKGFDNSLNIKKETVDKIKYLKEQHSNISNRNLGKMLGVSKDTVRKYLTIS